MTDRSIVTDPVIELVRELAANPKAGPALVAQSIGSKFVRIEEQSNASFDVFKSAAPVRGGLVSSLEMRVRRTSGMVKIFVLTVDTKKHCVKEPAVTAVFGKKFEFAPPTPRSSGSAPTYYSYDFADHKVSFGFDRSAMSCFSSIVVEFSGN